AVAPDAAAARLAQQGDQAVHAPLAVDDEGRDGLRRRYPQPTAPAGLLPARLVDMLDRGRTHGSQGFGVGTLQGLAHFLRQVGNRADGDRHLEERLGDLFLAPLADVVAARQVAQRGGQAGTNTMLLDGSWDGGVGLPATARTGAGMALVFDN